MFPLASVATVILVGATAVGGTFLAERPDPKDPNLLIVGGGYSDVIRNRYPAAELRLGYRPQAGLWVLRPLAAGSVTSKGATFLCVGFGYDVVLGHATITPSFAPGFYSHASGIDLGYPLEFRSQLDVTYRLDRHSSRIGVSFSHTSNAQLGSHNPGTEVLMLNYSIALSR
jgi:lipid A 3-O-deacylase